MEVVFEFEPVKRLCDVASDDISPDTIVNILGQPDEVEKGQNSAPDETSIVYHFHSHQLTLFFTVQGLVCFAVTNPEFKLFGEPVFQLHEEELIFLFKTNGFSEHMIDKDWGEKQLIFDEAGVTIFFDNQKVSEIFIDM
jgi:hypothetical protein